MTFAGFLSELKRRRWPLGVSIVALAILSLIEPQSPLAMSPIILAVYKGAVSMLAFLLVDFTIWTLYPDVNLRVIMQGKDGYAKVAVAIFYGLVIGFFVHAFTTGL